MRFLVASLQHPNSTVVLSSETQAKSATTVLEARKIALLAIRYMVDISLGGNLARIALMHHETHQAPLKIVALQAEAEMRGHQAHEAPFRRPQALQVVLVEISLFFRDHYSRVLVGVKWRAIYPASGMCSTCLLLPRCFSNFHVHPSGAAKA